MFRLLCIKVNIREILRKSQKFPMIIQNANVSKVPQAHGETDDEFDVRMECYFSREDIDGWELRKGLNDLAGMDLVPDPKIIIAALYAARRLNDYAVTTRMLEMVKMKCGVREKKIWPYILQEIEPTLTELGVELPDDMGYCLPELALVDVHDVNVNSC